MTEVLKINNAKSRSEDEGRIEAETERYLKDPDALHKLLKSNQLLHEFVEKCPNAMCVYNEAGVLLTANAAYQCVHPTLPMLIKENDQVTFTDIIRAQHAEKLSGTELEAAVEQALRAFDCSETMVTEFDYGKNGYYRFTQFPLTDGAMARFAVEISAERKREQDLLRAREEAETASEKANEAFTLERERKQEARLLSELGEWLQSCKSLEELYKVVEQFMARFFPRSEGEVYLYSNSRDVLFGACNWPNDEAPIHDYIHADDCWSLRRGRMYKYGSGLVDFKCQHVESEGIDCAKSVCIPLIAHGDTIGMLHIRFSKDNLDFQKDNLPHDYAFALRCSEQVSLAIANVRLRDELREQSTRDSLTGLYNRRFFTEHSRRELTIARSKGMNVSLLALDADFFKRFNDNYGHDAGDTVLRSIADTMLQHSEGDGIVARLGGEEFAILLPDTSAERAVERAEELRCAIESNTVRYADQNLPATTLSIGVAVYPDDGSNLHELMGAADQGLYNAKKAGRNCVKLIRAEASSGSAE